VSIRSSVFECVRDAGLPIVTNVLAARATLAFALGVSTSELRDVHARRLGAQIASRLTPRSGWRGTTLVGEGADVRGSRSRRISLMTRRGTSPPASPWPMTPQAKG
jgi:hypothetical protein